MISRAASSLGRFVMRIVNRSSARLRWAEAEDARREDRWSDVARLIEQMHRTNWENDNSHYLLGCAYVALERWQEAVCELDLIASPLTRDEDEQARCLNHALALSQTGRSREALGMLPARELIATTFSAFPERAVEMHDDLTRFLAGSRDASDS